MFFIIGYDMVKLEHLILNFDWLFLAYTMLIIILARWIQIKILSTILNMKRSSIPISQPFQTLMLIAGLRGAVAYAVSLETRGTYPNADKIITMTYLVTLITIFVFGAILEPYVDSVDILDTGEKLNPVGK